MTIEHSFLVAFISETLTLGHFACFDMVVLVFLCLNWRRSTITPRVSECGLVCFVSAIAFFQIFALTCLALTSALEHF